jgi:hypothetical protein
MFAQKCGSDHLNISFKLMVSEVVEGEFGLLDYCHHLTSGMKAVYTQDAMDDLYLMK